MKRESSTQERPDGKSSHKRGAPKGPRKAGVRKAGLIEAAEKIFVEKGYEAATMDEIAAEAGFAKGTLYHYFANKAELVEALREEFDRKISEKITSQVETCPENDWFGRVRAWIGAAVRGYFELSALHDVVVYGPRQPFRNAMADSAITSSLAGLISAGASAGAWQVDDARWTAVMMFYSYRGGCDEAMIGSQPVESIPEKLYDLFIRILGADRMSGRL